MEKGHSREAHEFWQDAFAHLALQAGDPKRAARYEAAGTLHAELAKAARPMHDGLVLPRKWLA